MREKPLYEYSSGRHRVVLFFPNSRQAAMGSLGFQVAYHIFNAQPDFHAERICSDFSLKEGRSYPGGEILALSIAYELDIINFIETLLGWGIEPLAEKRGGPLVVAGGVLTQINPLPLAPFVDIFLIGDGELLIPRFSRLYREHHLKGKIGVLEAAAGEPGCWVPAFGRPVDFKPVLQPRPSPLHSVTVSPESHFGEMFLIEVGRGCPRKCRFCASSHIHDYEFHPPESILQLVDRHIQPPTVVGLIGSALSDYPELEYLLSRLRGRGYRLGISSLRPDAVTPGLAKLLVRSGVKTLTIAPEAGSLKLRRIIGKTVSDERIFQSVGNASKGGISKIKLYFMIGLPEEDEGDIEGIVEMVKSIIRLTSSKRVEISLNAFIPKPHTPFQWAGAASESYNRETRALLMKRLRGVKFSPKSPYQETLQALISRGDENVGLALLDYIRDGVSLKQAIGDHGNDAKAILSEKAPDAPLPWDCFTTIEDKERLLSSWKRA